MVARFPRPLKKGDTIGFLSPSSTNNRSVIDKGADLLKANGYKVFIHPQNDLQNGQLAGSDEEKTAALMELFIDPDIDGIVCARGGNGAIRLLKKLDFNLIAKHPKTFVGYSDTTALLQAINKKSGFVTYHGPMASSFGRDLDPRSVTDFFAQVEGRAKTLQINEAEVLQEGEAEGVLVGGNMSLLECLIGTEFDWETDKAILFIEDVDELVYRVDRVLNHYELAGKFKNIAAVMVGEMVNVPDGETLNMNKSDKPYGFSIEECLRAVVPKHVPICMNFPCGHGKYITTLPVGGMAKVSMGKNGVTLSFG